MKFKHITLFVLAALLLASCMKEGDFDALRHPVRIQGEFDPIYGVPLVKLSADMATLVGMFDSNANLVIYIDDNGTAAFRYTHHELIHMDWQVAKGAHPRRKGQEDTTYASFYLTGNQEVDLFDNWDFNDTNSIRAQEVRVTLDALLKAQVNESFQDLIDRGANLYFDNLSLTGECNDGYVKTIHLLTDSSRVFAQELIEGTQLKLLDKYNFAGIIQHQPNNIIYSVRANLAIPSDLINDDDFNLSLEQIGVEQLDADVDIAVDFPLEFYCENFEYHDTLPLDLSAIELELDSLGNILSGDGYQVSLNDDQCYLGFEARNQLPAAAWANAMLLDSNRVALTGRHLLADNIEIPGAPVVLNEKGDAYVSAGEGKKLTRIPFTSELLEQLQKARYIVVTLGAQTSTLGADGEHPIVAIRQNDKLMVRVYAVVSPHAQIDIPIDNPLAK